MHPHIAASYHFSAAVAAPWHVAGSTDIRRHTGGFEVRAPTLAGSTGSTVAHQGVRRALADITNTVFTAPAAVAADSAEAYSLPQTEDFEVVRDYIHSIMDKYFRDEVHVVVDVQAIDRQAEVTVEMRAILVDWLVEVHLELTLKPATLFLAVQLLDRYLALRAVRKAKLQLVGIVALNIAAKFEEDALPVNHMVHLTARTYTAQEIRDMECRFLAALNFKVLAPTAQNFLDHFQQVINCGNERSEVSKYVLELALQDFYILRHRPSRLAAAALLFAGELSLSPGAKVWQPIASAASRASQAELEPIVRELRKLHEAAPAAQLQTVYRKFQPRLAGFAHRHRMAKTGVVPR